MTGHIVQITATFAENLSGQKHSGLIRCPATIMSGSQDHVSAHDLFYNSGLPKVSVLKNP
jgi:hypothetical protein